MAKGSGKPDFIVSPNGEVRDVRWTEYYGQPYYSYIPSGSTSTQGTILADSKRAAGASANDDIKHVLKGVLLVIGAFVVAAFLALGLLSYAQWQGQQRSIAAANTAFQQAEYFYFKGEYELAVLFYSEGIRATPDDYKAYNNRALAYLELGKYDDAIADCSRSISLQPGYYLAYNNRGVAYARKTEYGPAVEDFTTAIGLFGEIFKDLPSEMGGFGKAYYNRGLVYYEMGQYDPALSDLSQAVRYGEMNPYTKYIGRLPTGTLMTGMEGMNRRIEEQQHQVDLPSAYLARGAVYYARGEYSEAIADFSEAIKIQPNLAKAYFGRGAAYLGLGDVENAVSDLHMVLRLGNDPEASQAAESLLLQLGVE